MEIKRVKMAAFFRKNNKTTIAELEEYYAAQNNSRRSGRAWLMAILSLLLTVLVLFGLFFGGRWIYRALTDDNNETTIITDSGDTQLPSYDGDIAGSVNTNTGSIDDLNNSNSESASNGVVDDQAASTDTANSGVAGSSTTAQPTTTPATSTTNDLPNTGAGTNMLMIFVSTVVIGYLVSRKSQLSK